MVFPFVTGVTLLTAKIEFDQTIRRLIGLTPGFTKYHSVTIFVWTDDHHFFINKVEMLRLVFTESKRVGQGQRGIRG